MAASPVSQQAQLATQSQPKPAAEAARVDTGTPATTTEERPQQPRASVVPPKPFSLATRIRQPDPSDLPEAPSVDRFRQLCGYPAGGAFAPARAPGARSLAAPGTASRRPTASAPPPSAAQQPPPRIGGKVQEPKLLRRVDAVYPPMARQARVGGVVRIQASIGKDGKVRKVEVLSGPPLLRQAAIDAVQKWVYSPSLLNGAPVESTTDVDVNFNLSAR